MNILHLEMSRFFSKVIQGVAVSEGFEYRNEQSIDNGIAALDELQFDLIITAHILKDGQAEDFLRKIAELKKHKDLPVIIVSSDDSIEYRETFFRLGVVDYLLKSDLVPEKISQYFKIIARNSELLEELKNFKIAVLDDSNFSLTVIKNLFHFYGLGNTSYFNSPRAMLNSGDYDLYIIDMVMPEMSGDELILAIRNMGSSRGIIVVSGVSNRLSIAHALTVGADDFVTKPFDGRDFMARMKGVVRNMVLMRQLEEKSRLMEEASFRDSLTKLWNHGHIHSILDSHLSSEKAELLVVLLFDLDNFKSINDRFGHPVGDKVLLAATEILLSIVGEKGEVGRYGGEEFLAVLPRMGADEGRKVAEKILEKFRKAKFSIPDLKMTASCGMAIYSEVENAEVLVERADERLYTAKKAGKDRVVDA